MQRLMIHLALMAVLFVVSSCSVVPKDELFNKFENPPAEAKPFVRWWWGENAVVDLIVGSGWPFGAEFLKPGEMTKRFLG